MSNLDDLISSMHLEADASMKILGASIGLVADIGGVLGVASLIEGLLLPQDNQLANLLSSI